MTLKKTLEVRFELFTGFFLNQICNILPLGGGSNKPPGLRSAEIPEIFALQL